MFSDSSFEVRSADGYTYLDVCRASGTAGKGAGARDEVPLLLLHGMFGGLSNFDGLIHEMEGSGSRVWVPRIPLYEMPRGELDIPGLADWVLGFMDHFEIRRPVVLGNSMGGHVALDLARRCPGRLRSLVLTGSSGLMEKDFGTSFPKRNDREYIRQQASLTFYEDLVDEKMIDEIQEVVLDTRKMIKLLSLARETHDYYMEDLLPEIPHRTLLVWGRQDRITPPEVGEMFRDLMPRAELKWIDRCGHAPMMERPALFARHLNEFLSQPDAETPTEKPIPENEEDYTHI